MPRYVELWKGHKTHQVLHIWLMEKTSFGTVSDYIASIAKQHAPGRKKFFHASCWPSICNIITSTVNKVEHSLNTIWLSTKIMVEGESPSKDENKLVGCEYSSLSI